MSLRAHARRQVQTATIESTFGPNPCQRNMFLDEADVLHTNICNGATCPDCGPRKAATLWQGITQTFGAQVLLIGVTDDDEYRKVVTRIRQQRHRDTATYQYVSFQLDATHRAILTDAPLTVGDRVMTASIKKGLLQAYQRGVAQLRKSWDVARVTLSTSRLLKSVTGRLKWVNSKALQEIAEDKRVAELVSELGGWQVWDDLEGTLWDTITFSRVNATSATV